MIVIPLFHELSVADRKMLLDRFAAISTSLRGMDVADSWVLEGAGINRAPYAQLYYSLHIAWCVHRNYITGRVPAAEDEWFAQGEGV